jgi:hypothetical protein
MNTKYIWLIAAVCVLFSFSVGFAFGVEFMLLRFYLWCQQHGIDPYRV